MPWGASRESMNNSSANYFKGHRLFRTYLKNNPEEIEFVREEFKKKVKEKFTIDDLQKKLKDIYEGRASLTKGT